MKTFLTLLLLALSNVYISSQELIRWDFEDETGESTLQPTFKLDTSMLVNPVVYSDLFPLEGSSGFTIGVSGQPLDKAGEVRDWSQYNEQGWWNDWIEFRFINNENTTLDIDSVSFWFKRNVQGSRNIHFRSHKDNYSNSLDSVVIDESDVSWRKWSIPLDSFIVGGLEQVTFRIYAKFSFSLTLGAITTDSVAIYGSLFTAQPLHLRAFLAGSFTDASPPQRDDLRLLGLIPATDPYGLQKSTTPEVLAVSGDDAIVDWVLVEIRSSDDSSEVLASLPALLQKDGDVVATDGLSPPVFGLDSGQYYIAVRHRNHLGVMTASPVNLSDTVDFTLPETSVFGSNSRKQFGSSMFFWEGDVNMDGVVKYTGENSDRDPILQEIGGVVPTNSDGGYLDTDVNMDGVVKYTGENNDRDPILLNIGGVVPTNTRSGTLP